MNTAQTTQTIESETAPKATDPSTAVPLEEDNGNPHCDDCDRWSMTTGHRCWTPDGEHMYCEGCAEAHGDEFEEEEEEEDTITEDTIVAGIVCRACSHALPPMTVKQHLNGEFNKTCPHTA